MSDNRSVPGGGVPSSSPTVNIGAGDAQGQRSQTDYVPIPVVTAPAAGYRPPNVPNEKKPGSKLLVIGIILCAIALAALAAILYLVLARPFSTVNAPEPPQLSEVEAAFDAATIPPPELNGYLYIKTEGLTDPALSDFKTGNVSEDASAHGTFTCNGEAKATFQNDYVKAVVPLTVKMTHAADSTSWVPGGVDPGSPEVTPTGPADLEAMQANIQNILKAADQEVANQFVDCEVRPEASLNAQGGTVVFNLTKTVGEETKTCAVNTNVTWGDRGWNVEVTGITGLEEEPPAEEPSEPETPTEEEPASQPEQSGSSSNGGSTDLRPTMLLECWTGDLVRVPGTIQVQANGSILLRTDDVIRVVFNNMTYITTYFEITGSGSFQNGQHVIVDGAISATGTNPIAPLVINLNWS